MTASEQEQAFRNWVYEYSDQLYRFCLQRVQDEDLAKDLVQETFLSAWRNRSTYRKELSEKNWLFLILKSRIIDHFRKGSHEVRLDAKEAEDIFFDEEDHWRKGMYPRPWSVDASNALETKDFFKVFSACGKKLKSIQHHVFVMKYVEEMDSEEICKELGISSANYWVLIHRAKVQLRACLEKNWTTK